MSNSIQYRGHCQCCCRIQAVTFGNMAKHGYQVQQRGQGGWFVGVCGGHNFAPVEHERRVLDSVVVDIRADVAKLRALADKYEAGTSHPAMCKTRRYDHEKRDYVSVPWSEANEYEQAEALKSAIWAMRNRANAGDAQADMMIKIADEYHGKPLIEQVKPSAPAPVLVGERRLGANGVLVATRVAGARVYWTNERGFNGWTGTRAWRLLVAA